MILAQAALGRCRFLCGESPKFWDLNYWALAAECHGASASPLMRAMTGMDIHTRAGHGSILADRSDYDLTSMSASVGAAFERSGDSLRRKILSTVAPAASQVVDCTLLAAARDKDSKSVRVTISSSAEARQWGSAGTYLANSLAKSDLTSGVLFTTGIHPAASISWATRETFVNERLKPA